MPGNLDLGPGWTLRVTALAVSDGSVVPAVNVSNLNVELSPESSGLGDLLDFGPFMLVPGPGGDVPQPQSPGTNP